MEVSKEFKLGLLVLLGGVLLFMGLNFLKTGLNFGGSNEYYAVFEDASGVGPGSEVQMNGFKIGEVTAVGLHPANPMLVVTEFTLENTDIEIPRSSEAWLISKDVLGTKCIDLRLDTNRLAYAELLADGDTLISRTETTLGEDLNAEVETLKVKTERLISSIESIIIDVNALWDTSASYVIEESIYNTREAIATYRDLAHNLADLINRETQSASHIKENLNEVLDNVTQKMTSINSIATNLAAVKADVNNPGLITEMAQLNVSMLELNNWLDEVEKGQGTLGALTKTTEFQDALEETKQSMNALIKNISEDPAKYIGISLFGKKVRGLKLTKEEEKILKDWLAR